ncbi:hypothetical protein [Endozoicomonas sp. GU-1]|uniref:hypothetical protein n=1 Tax=Endozoicomonas sp. GU-1 TaxID=3009078 RepID=UPI0022B4F950|nr:hypothetical protein [Endozoicomonas sp. GU-1]WBA82440.1 hypothetical protein O2T12_04635 [Endozoicomonas sp. GU-1]
MKKNTQTIKSLLILLAFFFLLSGLSPPVVPDDFNPAQGPSLAAVHHDLTRQAEVFSQHPPPFVQQSPLPSDDWRWFLRDKDQSWDITLFDKKPAENQARLGTKPK